MPREGINVACCSCLHISAHWKIIPFFRHGLRLIFLGGFCALKRLDFTIFWRSYFIVLKKKNHVLSLCYPSPVLYTRFTMMSLVAWLMYVSFNLSSYPQPCWVIHSYATMFVDAKIAMWLVGMSDVGSATSRYTYTRRLGLR